MVPGVTVTADDVLAKRDSEINHYIAVLSLPQTAQNNNLKFNLDKIQFKIRESKFSGQLLTPDGMHVDPKKKKVVHLYSAFQIGYALPKALYM